MVAACDDHIQLWLNAKNLKSRDLWAAGWLQVQPPPCPAYNCVPAYLRAVCTPI